MIAPVPLQLMPKSMASPSLLAHITTAKFDDGLPLTRQSKQFERLALDIGASTMGVWMNTIGGEKVVPIIKLLQLYDGLAEAWKLLHFGCLSHCRRYFVTAEKVGQSPTGRTLAWVVIRDFIGALYGFERHIKALRERREQAAQIFSLDEVLQIRQEKGVPIAEAFKKWLDDVGPGVTPTSALGKAIAYSLS
jgi:hypothetical protein